MKISKILLKYYINKTFLNYESRIGFFSEIVSMDKSIKMALPSYKSIETKYMLVVISINGVIELFAF